MCRELTSNFHFYGLLEEITTMLVSPLMSCLELRCICNIRAVVEQCRKSSEGLKKFVTK